MQVVHVVRTAVCVNVYIMHMHVLLIEMRRGCGCVFVFVYKNAHVWPVPTRNTSDVYRKQHIGVGAHVYLIACPLLSICAFLRVCVVCV